MTTQVQTNELIQNPINMGLLINFKMYKFILIKCDYSYWLFGRDHTL